MRHTNDLERNRKKHRLVHWNCRLENYSHNTLNKLLYLHKRHPHGTLMQDKNLSP